MIKILFTEGNIISGNGILKKIDSITESVNDRMSSLVLVDQHSALRKEMIRKYTVMYSPRQELELHFLLSEKA